MKKLIGNKKFYLMVLSIAVPIMIQNGITNFVAMLDNIMVGRIGTEQMSGVAIVNQLIFVFILFIFGGVSGVGIFSAQYFGQNNHKGVRDAFRFKLVICGVIVVISAGIFYFFGEDLISLYLNESNSGGDIEATLGYAKKYFRIMLLQLAPFAVVQVYAGTLRETTETMLPMKAGIVAVFVNAILNLILIFGVFGLPALGVEGAAIATVVARFVEAGIVVVWTHYHKEKNIFIQGAFKHFTVPTQLMGKVVIKGTPLMVNEVLWAMGMAVLAQCYSMRGLSVVAAHNITSTISNVFNIVFIAMGSSVSIIIGQLLGAGKMKEAKESASKIIFFSVCCCIGIGIFMFLVGSLFPKIYNTTDEVKEIATGLIRIAALAMPLHAFLHATYFTIRSGGKTMITFLSDSVFAWVVAIPIAYYLSRYTSLNIYILFLIVNLTDVLKCAIGYILLKKGIWLHNIVNSD